MTSGRWRELTSEDDWDDVQGARGVIVISDVAGPARYHDPGCEHVTLASFTTKVLDNGGRNGRYWWAPSAEAAQEGGAQRCGAEAAGAFAARGSQRQVQLYVNQRADALRAAIVAALPGLRDRVIEWRSPLATDAFREYHDAGFLEAVGHPQLAGPLREFWPRGGPRWDALAVVDGTGILLVEGKSYPGELEGGGCKATPASQAVIRDALLWTRGRLGVAMRPPEDWCGPLYQSANRLAHLSWLGWRGIDAWLVHLLFTDDPLRPTSAEEWHGAMKDADARLGIAGVHVPGAAHVVLPAVD